MSALSDLIGCIYGQGGVPRMHMGALLCFISELLPLKQFLEEPCKHHNFNTLWDILILYVRHVCQVKEACCIYINGRAPLLHFQLTRAEGSG